MGKHSISEILLLLVFFMCVGLSMCALWLYVCNGTHLEVKGQLCGLILLRCRLWKLNSGHWACQQVPLPTVPHTAR